MIYNDDDVSTKMVGPVDMVRQLSDIETQIRFIYGGHALFTLRSKKTDKHYSYKINIPYGAKITDDPAPPYFVSVLVDGSADEGKFVYIGILLRDKPFLLRTKKSRLSPEAPAILALQFFFTLLRKKTFHKDLEVFHAGKCACCGRTLTDPISIERGIGPICWDMGQ
jgi:hypothetical protein